MVEVTRRTASLGMAGLFLAGAAAANPQPGRLRRFAGTGEPGFDGDGGPAVQARLSGPAGLGVDPGGNVFIADLKNHVIRRVDAKTTCISTVAGNGSAGFGGDDGSARTAHLNKPEGVAAHRFGNVYVADSGNDRIRRVDRNGVIATLAGGGDEDPRVFEGPARAVRLNHPAGVAVDQDGTVFFNDYGHDVVCAVTPDGLLRRVAGTGVPGYAGDGGPARLAQLNDVYGIALDPQGNLFICDSLNFAIRKVERASGIITTVAGDGHPATGDAPWRLSGVAHAKGTIGPNVPHAVDADGSGNIFVADTASRRLRRFSSRENCVLAGNGEPGIVVMDGTPALEAAIELHGVRVLPDGELVFLDYLHNAVYRLACS
jgi:DNA-binding beta-propeller fold protein YncE